MGSGSDPPLLVDLAAIYCMSHLTETLSSARNPHLRPGITLPSELCEKLMDVSDKASSFDEAVVPLFEVIIIVQVHHCDSAIY